MRKLTRNSNTNNIKGIKRMLKPVVEKKRRDRINQSLTDLRTSLLNHTSDARLQNPKLEKAEILDFAVEYLQKRNNRKRSASHSHAQTDVSKVDPLQNSDPRTPDLPVLYTAGFQQCVSQLASFMSRATPTERDGLLRGLNSYIDNQYSATFSPPQSQISANTDFHHLGTNGKPDVPGVKDLGCLSKQEAVKSSLPPGHSSCQPGGLSYPLTTDHLSPPLSPCLSCSTSVFGLLSPFPSLSGHLLFPPSLSPLSSTPSCSCSLLRSTMAGPLVPSPTLPLLSPPNSHFPSQRSPVSVSRQEWLPTSSQIMWRPWF